MATNQSAPTVEPAEVPAWLRLPPDAPTVQPPFETRPETLPIAGLPWPDVERLFLRLAEKTVGDVESAGLYGTVGQAQDGIDLYVRHIAAATSADKRRYTTLQSRRVEALTETKIENAVSEFLAGSWGPKSKTFIYATTHSLKRTQLANEINKQADRLEAQGITLLPWGLEQTSELLRSEPQIVDDFFGREWVRVFCGDQAADELGTRLPGGDVAALRSRLAALYGAVFTTQDTGFALVHGATRPSELSRFVLLDIAPQTAQTVTGSVVPPTTAASAEATPTEEGATGSVELFASRRSLSNSRSISDLRTRLQLKRIESDLSWLEVPQALRVRADRWISQIDFTVVSGPPGSGKSTLLRHIVADLLSADPKLDTATKFAGRLPVWLPFAFLCTHLAEGSDRSIQSAAKAWLTHYSAADLTGLVDRALGDDRLLLVIDGLDEWSDINAANHAFGLLEAFLGGRPVAAVASSRPYGLRRLPGLALWQVGKLAPLTDQQQQELASAALSQGDTSAPSLTTVNTDRFLAELRQLPDLGELARVPLFLLLLAGVWVGEPIPTRKYAAYSRLVELLIDRHPAIRRRAAAGPAPSMRTADLRRVLAAAAFELRCIEPGLVVPKQKFRRLLVDAMTNADILALDVVSARLQADQVIDVAEDELGILVQHGAGAIGFIHRVVAEQLAADHLAALPLDAAKDVVRDRVADPPWRDILLATLIGQHRPSDAEALLTAAIDSPNRSAANIAGHEYRIAGVANGASVTPRYASETVETTISRVRSHPWTPHRARLLASLVHALGVPAIAPTVKAALSTWLPARTRDTATAIGMLRHRDVAVDDAAEILLWGMRHPDKTVRAVAAEAAADRFGGSNILLDELVQTTYLAASAEIQAAALFALTHGWPDHKQTIAAVAWARTQTPPVLKMIALDAAKPGSSTKIPAWTDSERSWLLSHLNGPRNADRIWGDLDENLVAAASSGDKTVRDLCLKYLREQPYAGGNYTLCWSVLTAAFPGDPETVAWAAQRIQTDLIFSNSFKIGPAQQWLTEEPAIAAAVEARLLVPRLIGLPDNLAFMARLAPGSARVRDQLISALDRGWAPWWAARALVDLFSGDSTAQDALREKLTSSDADVSAPLAWFAIDVLGIQQAMRRLRELVTANPKQVHLPAGALAYGWHLCDQIANGLAEPQKNIDPATAEQVIAAHPADDVVPLCLTALPDNDDQTSDDWVLVAWPDHPAVVERAASTLKRRTPAIAPLIKAYGHRADSQSRSIVEAATKHLHHLEAELRTIAAEQLGRPSTELQAVLDLLGDWRSEEDPEARRAAATTLTQALLASRNTADETLPALTGTPPAPTGDRAVDALDQLRRDCRDELQASRSLDDDSNRRVAWTIMLLLGDLSLLDGLTENYGTHAPVGAALVNVFGDVDTTLATLVAANWNKLNQYLEPDWIKRLAPRMADDDDLKQVWAGLATVAHLSPEIAQQLRDLIQSDPSLLERELVLSWYLNDSPNDPQNLQTLVDSLSRHQTNDKPLAITLLARYATPEQIGHWLTEKRAQLGDGWKEMPTEHLIGDWGVVLLAETIPDDPRVAEMYERLRADLTTGTTAHHWGWPEVIALTFAAAPPSALPLSYLRLLARMQLRDAEYFGSQLLSAVAKRLRRDPKAVDAWAEAIANPGTAHVPDAILARAEEPILGPDVNVADIITRSLLASVLAATVHIEPGLAERLRSAHAELDSNPAAPVLWQDAIGVSRSAWIEQADVLDTTG